MLHAEDKLFKPKHISLNFHILEKLFETCFNEFAELFTELELKEAELEVSQRDHFVELQKKLDLTRDSLKLKIDKIVKDFYF